MNNGPIILLSSNYAWTILNFRLPLIESLINEGYRVEIITQYDGYEVELEKIVHKVHPLFISRMGINPIIDLITFVNFFICILRVKPQIFLPFTIKPVIYGSLAARLLRTNTLATITGLGTAFIKNNWITKLVKRMYQFSFDVSTHVFFQNSSDLDLFVNNGLVRNKQTALVPGSGIDTSQFISKKNPSSSPTSFILIARLLWDKGIGEYAEAAKKVKALYPDTKFNLLGPLGTENRSTISQEIINEFEREGIIDYLGDTNDVRPYYEDASCVVLPSYREGLSRVLLEAAAMSRPIIASDVAGCREVVDDHETGFLCNVRDSEDLSQKMIMFLALNNIDRIQMGTKGRIKVEKEFNIGKVCRQYLKVIHMIKNRKSK